MPNPALPSGGPDGTSYLFAAVTPHDSTDLADGVCRGLYVGGAGDVKAVRFDGVVVTFIAQAGSYHPIGVRRVNSTGTTATGIVALY